MFGGPPRGPPAPAGFCFSQPSPSIDGSGVHRVGGSASGRPGSSPRGGDAPGSASTAWGRGTHRPRHALGCRRGAGTALPPPGEGSGGARPHLPWAQSGERRPLGVPGAGAPRPRCRPPRPIAALPRFPRPLILLPAEGSAFLATVPVVRGVPRAWSPVPAGLVPMGPQQPQSPGGLSLSPRPQPWGSPAAALAGSSTPGCRQHSCPLALAWGGDNVTPGACG